MSLPQVVSRDEWLLARKQLLLKEKELTRHGDDRRLVLLLDLTALGRQEEWEEPEGRVASAHSAIPDFA
jgi:predicted dithiol-disulfide oxidoreductase (DUF899 family)